MFAAFDRGTVRVRDLVLHTGHGLFSADRLDEGTALLLDHLPPMRERALELGCGYGALALPIAAQGIDVLAVDRDLVAVRYTERNAAENGVRIEVRASLGYGAVPERGFSAVLSNVPARIGRSALAHFVEGGTERLAPGGEMRVVAIRDLVPVMEELGGERVADGPRHSVLAFGPRAPRSPSPDIYLRDEVQCAGLSFARAHDVSEDPGHARDGAPLLAEMLPKRPSDVLVWRSAHGVMAVLLARRGARVVCADRDLLALESARLNAARHGVTIETRAAAWLPEIEARPLVIAELSSAAGPKVAAAELGAVGHNGLALVPRKLAKAIGARPLATRGDWCVATGSVRPA